MKRVLNIIAALCLMKTFRDYVKHFCEFLASLECVRREAATFGSIQYIVQRRKIFDQFGIDLVLDVGANNGNFAAELRSFYSGEIISFEPVSATFQALLQKAAGDANWKCHKLALGDQSAAFEMNVSRDSRFSSFLEANEYCKEQFGRNSLGDERELVSVRRLDEVMEELVSNPENRRIFLKIDTQGSDAVVFKSLGNKVKFVDAVQSEISVIPIYKDMVGWKDSLTLYEACGFQVAGLFPVTLDSCKVIEFDCLMVRDRCTHR